MSTINISRVVENISRKTNIYLPIIEVVVNAIQAIELNKSNNGKIEIIVNRVPQVNIEKNKTLEEIIGFTIIDNGIGFTKENRTSFDTLCSDYKIKEGGKGFGRFVCLKYFEDLSVESIYRNENGNYEKRTFVMGKKNDIIENEEIENVKVPTNTGTTVKLLPIKKRVPFSDKKLFTIAGVLVGKLLPYFISGSICPKIILREEDNNSEVIALNNYLAEDDAQIKELIDVNGKFTLNDGSVEQIFKVKVFKFYSPKNQKSQISLVAHNREVTNVAVDKYINEFEDEFYETYSNNGKEQGRNFIIKVYVFGSYLDAHVSLERGDFEFQKENDILLGISQNNIESEAAKFAQNAVTNDISTRKEKKLERVQKYVQEQAPWHTSLLKDIDLSSLSYNPTDEQIEIRLHQESFTREISTKNQAKKLLKNGNIQELRENAANIVENISENSKAQLIHYIALRRTVIEFFTKSLELDTDGNYASEGTVHDIIFPRKGDSIKTPFEEHNLWIIDERLTFTDYVSSDTTLDGNKTDRPDLIAYGKRIVFRGDNEPSNPIAIFEFKKPQRDDFVNPSSNEDPIRQIIRYVIQIREGKFKTPKGREIRVSDNTPFYGYVICDLTPKVKKHLAEEHSCTTMPDNLGYFKWHGGLNLYLEVLSWDKVLRDATMRNKIFFHKLGIE